VNGCKNEDRMIIPQKGKPRDVILETLKKYKAGDLDWRSGKIFGYIYDPGEKVRQLINAAYTLFLSENALDPTAYPSLLRLENEVVRMTANLLQGDPAVVGNFTSGGTESILLAVKTARDMMRARKPSITAPEMVFPLSAHASFYKAGHYLGVKPVVVPVHGDSFEADVRAMADAVNENTILLAASAPGYAHGVIDPIEAIGRLALEKKCLFHVDACVGGIHLAYMRKMGTSVKKFDFSVPGVSSISVDLHKYGYAAKGASVILYRHHDIRRFQMFACSRWTGYSVINPTAAGSKSGGPLAAAWAVLNYLGDEGYQQIVGDTMAATRTLVDGINRIDGLRVLGKPDMCLLAFAAEDPDMDVFHLADRLKQAGWYIQPQFARGNAPSSLHMTVTRRSARRVTEFLGVLERTVTALAKEPPAPFRPDITEKIETMATDEAPESYLRLARSAGISLEQPPQDMAPVNRLLESLPPHVAEHVLTVYLNQLMK